MPTDLDEQVSDFILKVTDAMGLTLASSIDEFPDHVRVSLSGDDADVLVRHKGEALDALQVIVNTAFGREARGDRHYVVDALDFRKGKDAELQQSARVLMDKVKTTGSPEEMGPLNPYARRLVHLTVSEDAALASASLGDSFLKVIVISKK